MKEEAVQVLCESVTEEPWNWSAWLDLAELSMTREAAMKLNLPLHVMRDFFYAHVCLELQQNAESLRIYQALLPVFPGSNYILAQTAIANYNLREFDEAEQLFELLQRRDPYRLTNMDVYSNILYVKEEHAKLSYLAHKANLTDKYREESCCVIGNYYSLKSDHQKAVLYFFACTKT